ncbi:recombination directionality factor [Ramlibacter alkalitolerans]|uniref:Hydrolase or metal-binding protein n=1 Tax=Ramlibacter alkalitolerans TaxID=2039631 RepID=A0ABS1JV32_9BURK|nr:hydrolase or metal-binding protein [Ramlibacter alkalitolerans]MBL0427976.1 hydrolase or metal-binding protein [Ramlibacter alkalitolerans]
MLRGLAITPPVLGRISIGRVVEKNGKRLPEKDDEFTVTTQVQGRDGWITHPIDESLRGAVGGKLRSIPVWLPFSDPDLNLRASYSMFDRPTGRPLCVGNGETCRRSTAAGVQSMPCPAPEGCDLAASSGCKPYARLNVRIGNDDELGTFIFRTTGFNSIRTLAARLHYLRAVSGGLLATLPLELRLRGKSTTQSHGAAIYFADLTTRTGATLADALAQARELDASRRAAGFDQDALDHAAREGLALGVFEESAEEGGAVVEEFFPDSVAPGAESTEPLRPAVLGQKLANRVSRGSRAKAGSAPLAVEPAGT